MVMRIFSILAICFFSGSIFAQYDKLEEYEVDPFIKTTKGLIKATATIEPGYMIVPNIFTVYASANLEYYMAKRLSVRADVSYFFDTEQGEGELLANHGLHVGGVYHFVKKPIVDPYVGFQTGLHLTRTQYEVPGYVYPQPSYYKVVPTASIIGGANFYVSKYFNLYVAGRAVFGDFRGGKVPDPMNLTELRFSFGLGFHLGLKDNSDVIYDK